MNNPNPQILCRLHGIITLWKGCIHVLKHGEKPITVERVMNEPNAGIVLCGPCTRTHEEEDLNIACEKCMLKKYQLTNKTD